MEQLVARKVHSLEVAGSSPAPATKRMAKEFVINTSRLNSYGFRVLTGGIDISQFTKNPLLLFMHRRAGMGETLPIGTVENLRFEGDMLIGTPVFDEEDEFAQKIARKWDKGVLRMCSAGLEPIELTRAPEHIIEGQTRETVSRSKLVEVSIVDIGSNDDALQLLQPDGKLIQLSADEDNAFIPLLKIDISNETGEEVPPRQTTEHENKNALRMEKILLALGLTPTANEDEAVNAIQRLKTDAEKASTIELARITGAVEDAIKANKANADKREHLINLGKSAGFDALQETINMLTPATKPMDIVSKATGTAGALNLKYSEMTPEQLVEMRDNNREGYIRLYKAEFGFPPTFE